MNFAIEVIAEANPLTDQNLFHVLQSASSNDQQQVKSGTQQLQNWEKASGFYSSLQSLLLNKSLPFEVRYLSVIQLKNGIDKYWRKTATNAINKDEKHLIRSRSLESGVNEPDRRLALQISIVIAKITRYEYPHDWPDVMESILEQLQPQVGSTPNSLPLSRTLLILLYIIKELSTAKLQRSRASLQSAAPNIVEVVGNIYVGRVKTWITFLTTGGDDEGEALESIEISLLALQVLRRLIVSGYDFPNRQAEIRDIWKILVSHFGQMLALVQESSRLSRANPRKLIENHLIQISKLHINMVQSHPVGYALLPDSTGLSKAYWGLARQFGETLGSQTPNSSAKIGSDGDAEEGEGPSTMEKLTLKGLLLIRACLKMVFNPVQTFKYQKNEDKEERKTSKDLMRNDLLSGGFAREVMETLVTRFFVFTARDLKEWEEEPDEWEKTQEGGGSDWEFSIRSCSEKLFLDLMINYKDMLMQPLLTVFRNVATVENTQVLLKDSIYAAIGLAAPVLERNVDFDFGHFLNNTLVQEVQIPQSGYNILRRRAAVILGQWLPVKEGLNRPLVYQIFQHLLDKRDQLNDQVVRVTTGRQLRNVVDPFEFAAEPFMPYVPNILGSLMALIEEVELPDTKMALLNTINVIVTKMEQHISPFADQIISLLPPLWDQAGEEYLMKQSILGILSALATSMQAESRRYHHLIIPLIQSSINPNSESRVYLLEDALELWSTVLGQTPPPAPSEIVSLVQYLFPMFEVASETLRKALEITELYIYLIPSEFLTSAALIFGPFGLLLGSIKPEASGTVTSLVELLIRSADKLGGVSAVEDLTQSMISSNLLSTLLSGLHNAYLAHQTTGPNKTKPSIDGIIETDYLNVCARLAVASPSLLISGLEAALHNSEVNGSNQQNRVIEWLLTEWFSHMDNIGHPAHKKLNCLALTSFLETGQPWIVSRLQSLMTVWTDVVTELVVDASLEEGKVDYRDSLVYNDPNAQKPDGPEAPADERRRVLDFEDPVHRIDVRVFIREKLAVAVEKCGGMETFQREWVQNVDEDVVRAFGALGIV
ncbi:hypothetical protein HO133_009029 [Letharia lupina]|uniref:Importin N-terminal domain-containing protein n=1 Tax=Letharia lupina TaxID=560253 RepID=A0A8H6CMJ0_9LECA|nr:uncharacterized protein HO133_009029 [Letharia lupina]KAF6226163.1 hypothetical protein HO133_009029 [Letharia lupina]